MKDHGQIIRLLGALTLAVVLLTACSTQFGDGEERVEATLSLAGAPFEVEVRIFQLPEGLRHFNHPTYSLKMGKDGFLYFGVGDNAMDSRLLRFDTVRHVFTDLGGMLDALPEELRDQGNYGKVHVGPHQTGDGAIYLASYNREYWEGEQQGRLFRYRTDTGITDLGPTPTNQGTYFMHGDDRHGRLYFAHRDSHFTTYDIATARWEDLGRFSSKPPFIGLTDTSGRLYMYSYDGQGEFVPGPSTITRYEPGTHTLETSKDAPPTLWVGAVTPDHEVAYTTSYLNADLNRWRFSDWPRIEAERLGRIDPQGRKVFSNNLSLTADGRYLLIAGTIDSSDNGYLGAVHGVWLYDLQTGEKFQAAELNLVLARSYGGHTSNMRFYWTNANTVDEDGWIYIGMFDFPAGTHSRSRLIALKPRLGNRADS